MQLCLSFALLFGKEAHVSYMKMINAIKHNKSEMQTH